MITQNKVLLITKQRSDFFLNFEAMEYIQDIKKTREVTGRNKIPIFVSESNTFSTVKSVYGHEIIEIPENLIGNAESFKDWCHYHQFECGDYTAGVMYDTDLERCIMCEISNYKGFSNLKLYNQFVDKSVDLIIYESNNFFVIPELGALKQGFLMIVPKKHYYSVAQFPKEIMQEYREVCKDIETILLKAFRGKIVTFMEHGSGSSWASSKKSIVHAHTHAVVDFFMKFKYKKMVQLKPCTDITMLKNMRYFSYQEGSEGQLYVTTNANVYIQHQYCRQVMALELGYAPDQYNWRCYEFDELTDATLFYLYKTLQKEKEGRIYERTKDFVEGFAKRPRKTE